LDGPAAVAWHRPLEVFDNLPDSFVRFQQMVRRLWIKPVVAHTYNSRPSAEEYQPDNDQHENRKAPTGTFSHLYPLWPKKIAFPGLRPLKRRIRLLVYCVIAFNAANDRSL